MANPVKLDEPRNPSPSEPRSRLSTMAPKGFEINPRAIKQMTREIQREFDKHPITVPVETNAHGVVPLTPVSTNYYGPVVNVQGDGAQLAWDNQSVVQNQVDATQQIAPGFELIAQAVTSTLKQLAAAGLNPQDQADAEAAANEVLTEVVREEPDSGRIRRGITALKGLLSPVAIGLHTGAADGAQEWAATAIQQLGDAAAF